LLRELRRLDDRHAALVLELEEVGATRDSLREDIRVLARYSDEDELRPQPDVVRSGTATAHAARLFEPHEVLRGMRVREVAARLMAMREDPDHPIHYVHLYELLARDRFAIAGSDGRATLLTQLRRSPVIRPADGAGMYRLDLHAPQRISATIRQLRAELVALDSAQDSDDLSDRRTTRQRLTAEIDRHERALEETLRTLGP
jgi:hypothetical protein